MKTTKLIATVMVAGLLFAACKQDPDYVLPNISVDTPELVFTSPSAAALPLKLTATREWTVRSKPDWITVAPADKGPASADPQALEVHAAANASYNQEGEIIFSIGLSKVAVKVTQPGEKGEIPVGSGTKEDPYTVKGVMDYVKAMDKDAVSPNAVYIKGIVSSVVTTFAGSGTYGNASFYISDDGSYDKEKDFYCFQVYYLGGVKWKTDDEEIKVGDNVIIYGKVTNYAGNTPETTGKGSAFVYELNGVNKGGDNGGQGGNTSTPSGTGTQADPYNAAAAVNAVANLTWTSNTVYDATSEVYVKGKISKIASKGTYAESGDYGNASFYISDDGTENGTQFYCYHVLYLGGKKYSSGTDIKVGDDVIVYGKLMNYQGKTPETASGAYLYSLNGTTEGGSGGGGGNEGGQGDNPGTPSGTGTLADPYNVAGAIAAVANLTWTSNDDYQSTDDVYVKGKISKIADNGTYTGGGTYGNASFYIKDEGSDTEFYVFRALYLGNKKFESGQTDIKVGDEVVICGKLMNYRGNTPETVAGKAYLYSLNNSTEGGSGSGGSGGNEGGGSQGSGGEQGGGQGGNEQGSGSETSEIKTVTVAEFNAAQDSDKQKYQLTGKVANIVMDKNDATKPNAYGNFDLVDDSGTVYVYGLTKTEKGLVYNDDGSFAGKANNDKSFESIGLKEGDTLTLIGYHYTYKSGQTEKIEVLGAYYVSHTPASSN